MRQAVRLREARYSIPAALNRGLQTGLPFAAIIAATVPVWGMSWYFDTENWAAAMWNSWAESRTDTWREAMVRAMIVLESAEPELQAVVNQSVIALRAGPAASEAPVVEALRRPRTRTRPR